MIQNREYVIEKSRLRGIEDLPGVLKAETGCNILRWYIS